MTALIGPGDGSRAVALGGGHGLNRTLQALSHVVDHVTAVVTAADDGGSSGRLRRDLNVVPPGDMRMALAALSPDEGLVRLLQYRFDRGELGGHSLGNLIIVALSELNTGDLVAGLDELAQLLQVRGRVLPCTTTPVTLHAETVNGSIAGQVEVAQTPRVRRVWLEPSDVPATSAAVDAIRRADLVVLGPGSLYTSIVPNLLVEDIGRAVAASDAPVALVANLREQPGETEGMDLADHLEALHEHVPGLELSTVLVHDGPDPSGPGKRLHLRAEELAPWAGEVTATDLLDGADGHDPHKLARVFDQLLRGA
ncbi:MAG: uridine diphosphate-N-acetylglucosamine-binding protein YvcK [Nitriliruptorales bacterium]|nr:uridine diphosphate-N-acetylglucosamine-binding protein YvcK [Nitriliruptorales bacterium]